MGTYQEQKELVKKIFPDLDDCEIDIINQLYKWQNEISLDQIKYDIDRGVVHKQFLKRTRYELNRLLTEHSKKAIMSRLTPGLIKKHTLIQRKYVTEIEANIPRKPKILHLLPKGEFVAFLTTYEGSFTEYLNKFKINNKEVFSALFKAFCNYVHDFFPKGYLSKMDKNELILFIRTHLYESVIYYMKQIEIKFDEVEKFLEGRGLDKYTWFDVSSPAKTLIPALKKAGVRDEEIDILVAHLMDKDFLSESKFQLASQDKILKFVYNKGGLRTVNDVIFLGCLIIGFEAEIDIEKWIDDCRDILKNDITKGVPLPDIHLLNTRFNRFGISEACPERELCNKREIEDIIRCKRFRE